MDRRECGRPDASRCPRHGTPHLSMRAIAPPAHRGGDPFETGSSRPLDFGHWAAHKLEQLTNYNLRHGEAVAIGIALDVTYSYLTGMLSEESWDRIIRVLLDLGLPVYAPELETRDLFAGLSEFREHLGGQLTILLLREIGEPVEVHEIERRR